MTPPQGLLPRFLTRGDRRWHPAALLRLGAAGPLRWARDEDRWL